MKKSFLSNQAKGTLLCVLGALSIAMDGLLLRYTSNVDNMSVMFYRNVISTTAMLIAYMYLEPSKEWISKFRSIGWLGLTAGIMWGAAEFMLIYAMQLTAVANVLVLSAASPIFSAIFSWILLREVIPVRTLVAALICLGIVILICSSSFEGGDSNVMGVFLALGASLCVGLYFSLLHYSSERYGSEPNEFPVAIVGGIFDIVMAVIIGPKYIDVGAFDFVYLCIMGLVVLPMSDLCLTLGPNYISATEASLYMLVETVVGPLIVWAAGFEAPPIIAVYGGTVLIITLAVHSILAIRESNRKAATIVCDSPDNSPVANNISENAQKYAILRANSDLESHMVTDFNCHSPFENSSTPAITSDRSSPTPSIEMKTPSLKNNDYEMQIIDIGDE